MTTPSIMELFERKEPLAPELRQRLYTNSRGGQSIGHKLIHAMLYDEQMNAWLNARLSQKKEALVRAWTEQEWTTYIFLHERPYRVTALLDLLLRWQKEKVTVADETYFDLLGYVYCNSENLWQTDDSFLRFLFAPPGRDLSKRIVMTMEHDRHLLQSDAAPTWTIYRGYHRFKRKLGWSWTTSPAKAIFFAKRLASGKAKPQVAIATCKREDIIAFLQQRGECEVVIDPQHVTIQKVVLPDYDFTTA